ncbi:uncharacterized protein [Acropora muricata]|uniref:uncharacterized protein isoform X2 n=1 Tax=Acropora muricata TaxID=159855 RepID=UPI0034E48D16
MGARLSSRATRSLVTGQGIMASMPTVSAASVSSSSPKVGQQKNIIELLQDFQKRIQAYGAGPFTPEQAKEIEKLKHIYHKLKAEHDKGVQEGKIPVVRTTALATPITHVLVPGHTLGTPGSVQMAKIAPATTALPTQQTTVIPASTVNAGVPGVQQAAAISKTILPQASLQQLQSHNVVINPGNLHQIQRPVAETVQMKASQLQVTPSSIQAVTPSGQQIAIRNVAPTVQGVKSVVSLPERPVQVSPSTPHTVTLQRTLVPSKSPVNMPITLAPSGTVSTSVPAGSHVTNIAPAPVATAATKGLHSTSQGAAALRGESSSSEQTQILTKRRLQDLLHEIDPREQMDDEVEDLLLQIADDFIESVVTASCQIAKHRKSNTLEVRDVQLHLERSWNMWIPGFGNDEIRPFKKQATTEAHKQRLALLRKSMKK